MEYLKLANEVVEGQTDALKAYIELKKAEGEIERALKLVQPLAVDEAEKYEGKTFKAFGATIEKKNASGRWDYSHIGAWNQAKEKLEYVQKIAQAGGGFDEQTTEQIEKAIKIEGKSTIAVKLNSEK